MSTALTMLVEPRLKQAIHLVSSEHQNSPPHCENVLNSYLLFSPLYIFLRSKNLSPTPCNLAARIVCILYSPFRINLPTLSNQPEACLAVRRMSFSILSRLRQRPADFVFTHHYL